MRCTGCGHPMDLGMDEDRATAWITESVRCWPCASRESKARALTEHGKEIPAGTRFITRDRSED